MKHERKSQHEFEFIHPFSDGNGRMGRLWQSLILALWNPPKPALADGLIEMTIPDKPNSRLPKYRLSDKGHQWLRQRRDG